MAPLRSAGLKGESLHVGHGDAISLIATRLAIWLGSCCRTASTPARDAPRGLASAGMTVTTYSGIRSGQPTTQAGAEFRTLMRQMAITKLERNLLGGRVKTASMTSWTY